MKKGIVSKFGGSSVRDANAMINAAQIVKTFTETKIVVISATYNTTNMLEKLVKISIEEGEKNALAHLSTMKERHDEIAKELSISEDMKKDLERLWEEGVNLACGISKLKECSPRMMDEVYSLGERISSLLFSRALKKVMRSDKEVIFFDVRKVLKTTSDFNRAIPLMDQTKALSKEHLLPLLEDDKNIIVTQGFIGSTLAGETTTLGREGSDFSAALLAEVILAETLQIWTDVPGVATTDPRLVESAKIIPELTYEEASTMAHLGAKVLFSKTLLPVMRENIPVFVGSSLEPEKKGSWICPTLKNLPYLRALALMKNQILVTLKSNDILPQGLFGKNVFDLISQYKLPTDFLNFKGNHASFLLSDSKFLTEELKSVLSEFALLKVEENLALISLVGNSLDEPSEKIFEVFKALLKTKPHLRLISQGTTSHSLSFLVPQKEAEDIAKKIHDDLLCP